MAIIIPSKNIYEINNPKIRDNVIDNVSVDNTIVSPNNEYEISVYNAKLDISKTTSNASGVRQGANYLPEELLKHTAIAKVANKIVDKIATISEIKIPKKIDNYIITKIYNEKKENSGTSYTQISKYAEEKIYYYQSDSVYTYIDQNDNIDSEDYFGKFDFNLISTIPINSKTLERQTTISDIATDCIVSFTATNTNKSNYFADEWGYEISSKSYNDILTTLNYTSAYNTILNIQEYQSFSSPSESDLSNLDISEDDEYYYIKDINLYVGRTIYCCATALNLPIPTEESTNKNFPCKIIEIQRNVENVEITFYGNTIGIDLTDGSVSYIKDENGNVIQGKGSKPYSLSRNELLQDSGKVGEIALTEHLVKNILTQYQKGKETATILCSISDYYSENDNTIQLEKLEKLGGNYIQTKKLSYQEGLLTTEIAYNFGYTTAYKNNTLHTDYIDFLVTRPINDIARANIFIKDLEVGTWSENPVVMEEGEYSKTIRLNREESVSYTDFYTLIEATKDSIQFTAIDSVYLYRYFDGDITEYIIEARDKDQKLVKEIYNQSLNNPTEITNDIYVEDNFAYLSFIAKSSLYGSNFCLAQWDIRELVGGVIPLRINLQNISNGSLKFSVSGFPQIQAISITNKNLPMSFRLHDEVIPMIFGANGEDVPMSRKQDGSPKVFEVVGSNIIYDGAVWQELTLQEKN